MCHAEVACCRTRNRSGKHEKGPLREDFGDALERIKKLLCSPSFERRRIFDKVLSGMLENTTVKEAFREEVPFEEYFIFEEVEEIITCLEKEI